MNPYTDTEEDDDSPFDLGAFATQELDSYEQFESPKSPRRSPLQSPRRPKSPIATTTTTTTTSASQPRVISLTASANIFAQGLSHLNFRLVDSTKELLLLYKLFTKSAKNLNFAINGEHVSTISNKGTFIGFDVFLQHIPESDLFRFITRKENLLLKKNDATLSKNDRAYNVYYVSFQMKKRYIRANDVQYGSLRCFGNKEDIIERAFQTVFTILNNIKNTDLGNTVKYADNDRLTLSEFKQYKLTLGPSVIKLVRISGDLSYFVEAESLDAKLTRLRRLPLNDPQIPSEPLLRYILKNGYGRNIFDPDESTARYTFGVPKDSYTIILLKSSKKRASILNVSAKTEQEAMLIYRFVESLAEKFKINIPTEIGNAEYYPSVPYDNDRHRILRQSLRKSNLNDVQKKTLLEALLPFFYQL